MEQPLRILLVGVDHPHGPLWRASLRHHPAFAMAGAVDGDPERAASLLAREETALPVMADLATALRETAPDAALVALPNDVTPDIIQTLARAGVPMLVEKPCAVSAAAFAPALATVREAGVAFLPAYLRRFSPVAAAMRDLIADEVIGEVVSADITFATASVALRNAAYLSGLTIEEVRALDTRADAPSDNGGIHWLFDRARSGGGIMHWLGVHWLDLLRMITGEEASHVSATVATRTGVPMDVEDLASVSMTMSGGAIATVSCAYTLPSGPDQTWITFHGTRGWMAWDGSGAELMVASDLPLWSAESHRILRFPSEERPGYAGALGWETLDAFALAVRHGRPLPIGADSANRILQLLDAIQTSHREGRRIALGG